MLLCTTNVAVVVAFTIVAVVVAAIIVAGVVIAIVIIVFLSPEFYVLSSQWCFLAHKNSDNNSISSNNNNNNTLRSSFKIVAGLIARITSITASKTSCI